MTFLETLLIGISLSMDALAVSIALGAAEHRNLTAWKILMTAFSFGLFQAVMPTIGWYGGNMAANITQKYGGIVACLLLAALGGKMIWDAVKKKEDEPPERFSIPRLLTLSVATSIDALLVGVSFACVGHTNIFADVVIIGCTTFTISAIGCLAGRAGSKLFGDKFEVFGGIILILIGIKILIFG